MKRYRDGLYSRDRYAASQPEPWRWPLTEWVTGFGIGAMFGAVLPAIVWVLS